VCKSRTGMHLGKFPLPSQDSLYIVGMDRTESTACNSYFIVGVKQSLPSSDCFSGSTALAFSKYAKILYISRQYTYSFTVTFKCTVETNR
jgi:hypothetical protein